MDFENSDGDVAPYYYQVTQLTEVNYPGLIDQNETMEEFSITEALAARSELHIDQEGVFDDKSFIEEALDRGGEENNSSNSNIRSNNLLLEEEEGTVEEPVDSSINLPSIFATTGIIEYLGQAQATNGESFQIYELPGYRHNCGLAGIYGRRVSHAEVVQQLLASSLDQYIRALMATDIATYISNEITTLPSWLERRVEAVDLGNLEKLRQEIFGNETFRREFFQDEEVFREYVINVIGAENSPMLRYNENNEGAMAAIAALNHVSLDIYQEFEQADRSRLLVKVFSYRTSQVNAPTISLLHMSQDVRNPRNLNHFQLLVPNTLGMVGLKEEKKTNFEEELLLPQEIWDKHIFPYLSKWDFLNLSRQSLRLRGYVEVYMKDFVLKKYFLLSESDKDLRYDLMLREFNGSIYKLYFWIMEIMFSEETSNKIIDKIIRGLFSRKVVRNKLWRGGMPHGKVKYANGQIKFLLELFHLSEMKDIDFNDYERILSYIKKIQMYLIFYRGIKERIDSEALNLISHRFQDIVRLILEENLYALFDASFSWVGLHLAVIASSIADSPEMIQIVLDRNERMDINSQDYEGQTALHLAILYDYDEHEIVGLLLERNANTEVFDNEGRTPLHIAASNVRRENSEKIISLLLDQGADPQSQDGEGRTAMHIVVEEAIDIAEAEFLTINLPVKVILLLLNNGAEINAQDYNGNTPLHASIHNGFSEMTNFLLLKRADINVCNNEGQTAVLLATHNKNIELVKFLLRKGANVMLMDATGKSFIDYIIEEKELEKYLVPFLIKEGRTINAGIDARGAQGINGQTVFHRACKERRIEIVKTLLHLNFDVNVKDSNGFTPLMLAIFPFGNNLEIIEALLAHSQVDVDAETPFGATILMLAVDHGQEEIVRTLLKARNIDIYKTNSNGATALTLAERWPNIKRILESHIFTKTAASKKINLFYQLSNKILLAYTKINIKVVDGENMATLFVDIFYKETESFTVSLNFSNSVDRGNRIEALKVSRKEAKNIGKDLKDSSKKLMEIDLRHAGWEEEPEISEYLMKLTKNVDIITLITAAQENDLKLVQNLLQKIDIEITDNEQGCEKLPRSRQNENSEIIQLLLSYGRIINSEGNVQENMSFSEDDENDDLDIIL